MNRKQQPFSRLLATLGVIFLVSLLSACSSSPVSEEVRVRLDTFDRYWEAMDEHYPYFSLAGVDWKELRDQYRPAVFLGGEPYDFYKMLAGMFTTLRDAHISLSIPPEVERSVTSLLDHRDWDIFFHDQRFFVRQWPEGKTPTTPIHLRSEKEIATTELLAVDGVPPMVSTLSFLMKGSPGSQAELTLRWPDGSMSRHVMIRPSKAATPKESSTTEKSTKAKKPVERDFEDVVDVYFRRLHMNSRAWTTIDHKGQDLSDTRLIAFLNIDSFKKSDPAVLEEKQNTIDKSGARALVIDLRGNPGGNLDGALAHVRQLLRQPWRNILDVRGTVELELDFFSQLGWHLGFGSYSGSGGEKSYGIHDNRWISMSLDPRHEVSSIPLFILVDHTTGSTAEHFARALQDKAGAVVIGNRTLGAEAALVSVEGADGSTLTFGAGRIVNHLGQGIQRIGVIPDVPIHVPFKSMAEAPRPQRRALRKNLFDHELRRVLFETLSQETQ